MKYSPGASEEGIVEVQLHASLSAPVQWCSTRGRDPRVVVRNKLALGPQTARQAARDQTSLVDLELEYSAVSLRGILTVTGRLTQLRDDGVEVVQAPLHRAM